MCLLVTVTQNLQLISSCEVFIDFFTHFYRFSSNDEEARNRPGMSGAASFLQKWCVPAQVDLIIEPESAHVSIIAPIKETQNDLISFFRSTFSLDYVKNRPFRKKPGLLVNTSYSQNNTELQVLCIKHADNNENLLETQKFFFFCRSINTFKRI